MLNIIFIMPIPAISTLINILFNENNCIEFLRTNEVFYTSRRCEDCEISMNYYESQRAWKCPKKSCRKTISLRANSFFSNSRLKCCQIMHLAYLWLTKASASSAILQTGQSEHSICDYYKYFRQLVSSFPTQETQMIGGQDVVVQIDEAKMGKRKYHQGHRVDGVWLVGGVELTPARKTFFVPVEDRSAATILPILDRYVAPGSIVVTDCWKAYASIQKELEMLHFTVNHSQTFRDPISGAHTNNIEGTWNGLKISINPRNRVRCGIEEHLGEFQWRRENKGNEWNAFIRLLKKIHYD
jgi:transposase-like protein